MCLLVYFTQAHKLEGSYGKQLGVQDVSGLLRFEVTAKKDLPTYL